MQKVLYCLQKAVSGGNFSALVKKKQQQQNIINNNNKKVGQPNSNQSDCVHYCNSLNVLLFPQKRNKRESLNPQGNILSG